jgi:hypothetical protein
MGDSINVGASGLNPSNQTVVDSLTEIMELFRQQVVNKTPPPLEGVADQAVQAFREINEALDLKPAPKR